MCDSKSTGPEVTSIDIRGSMLVFALTDGTSRVLPMGQVIDAMAEQGEEFCLSEVFPTKLLEVIDAGALRLLGDPPDNLTSIEDARTRKLLKEIDF